MFCGKCGLQITDENEFCPRCGKRNLNYQPNTPRIRDDNRTVYAEEAPQTSPQPEQAPPQNRYSPQSAPQQEPYYQGSEYYPSEPQPYPYPVQTKKKNSGGKALIITMIIVIAVSLGVGGFMLFTYFYHNSDDYKMQKAEELLSEEKIDEGLSYINDIKGDRADAVRAYADILTAKMQFAEKYNSSVLQTDTDAVNPYYKNLLDKYNDFTNPAILPKKLKDQYETYKTRFNGMNSVIGSNTFDYASAQQCVYAYRYRKQGNKFTLNDIQKAINTTDPAVNMIQEKMVNTDAYKEFIGQSQSQAAKTIKEFNYYTQKQLAQDKFDLNTYRTTQDEKATFTIQNPDAAYTAKVGEGLKNLVSSSDMTDNAATLKSALSYAWLAYCFEIE